MRDGDGSASTGDTREWERLVKRVLGQSGAAGEYKYNSDQTNLPARTIQINITSTTCPRPCALLIQFHLCLSTRTPNDTARVPFFQGLLLSRFVFGECVGHRSVRLVRLG